jgi:hypothetical protein
MSLDKCERDVARQAMKSVQRYCNKNNCGLSTSPCEICARYLDDLEQAHSALSQVGRAVERYRLGLPYEDPYPDV